MIRSRPGGCPRAALPRHGYLLLVLPVALLAPLPGGVPELAAQELDEAGAEAQAHSAATDSGPVLSAPGVTPVERRARNIGRLFAERPGGYDSIFAPSFLAQVPTERLDEIFVGYYREQGPARDVEIIGPMAGGVTIVRLRFESGSSALVQLQLEPVAPHRIAGALVGPVFTTEAEAEAEAKAEAASPAGRAPRVLEPTYDTDGYETRTVLRLPFDGQWWVFWGGRTRQANYHRASALQRYAYDFVVRKDGSTHGGDGTVNEDYWCWGRPILAPAAGTVVAAVDGVPENVPGELNADRKLGNHVVIDHANGEFSLLAHLRTGSVAVEKGDRVAPGDPLGACGNSGNSTEAHLHYQLQTGPGFFESTAIPAPFHDYHADGVVVGVGEPLRGQTISPLPDEATDR